MGDVVVEVERLGKCYQIAHRRKHKDSLGEAVAAGVRGLGRRLGRLMTRRERMDQESFWALRDVSFQVRRGEVLGLIGRNGAGKSTLLKMLARITEPTVGRFGLRGRVSSLLEVGTGFHPELTGRENVYLNGAILGMRRAEISRKFDEIVAFAEVEQFLDTPVKRYSSGMYTRLAFAVAAHLEPEILIIDEVLAVGDAAFQKKCLGKITDVVRGGRAVLFVSHNMTAVSSLCNRVIHLENGRADYDGPVRAGIDRYMQSSATTPLVNLRNTTNRVGKAKHGRFVSIGLFNTSGQPCDHFAMGDALIIEAEFECTRQMGAAEITLGLANALGTYLHLFVSTWEGLHCKLTVGRHRFKITIPRLLVYPGTYALTPWLRRGKEPVEDQVNFCVWFTVIGANVTGHNPDFQGHVDDKYASKCEVYCPSSWRHFAPEANRQPAFGGTGD
jgi:lipopolysaccharide transport system ATP-binding protein